MPFYSDWTFWAVVVAALALVLSQLPPVHQMLRRSKLAIELYSRVHIAQKIGNPNVQLHIILTNTGGRSVKIRGATLTVRREGKEVATLPAQNYVPESDNDRTVLFTSFTIKPKEEWAHIVNFLNYFSRSDEKTYRAAEATLKRDLGNKLKLAEGKGDLVEADPVNVEPFVAMFNSKFVWQPGEYEIHIAIDAVPKTKGLEKKYRFTLFETDSAELAKAKDDFRLGDGVYWNSGNHGGLVVQLVEA